MAPDPQTERLRLVIEPRDGSGDGSRDASGGGESRERRSEGEDESGRNRPEETIDLDRLAEQSEQAEYAFEDEPEAPRRSRVLPASLGVIALMGFAAVSWYAYDGVMRVPGPESIPLIVAESGPIKTRPTAPGGLEVPHQDKLVLNEIAPDPSKPQVERLLPPPEVPKPPQLAAPGGAPAGEASGPGLAQAQAQAEALPGAPGSGTSAPLAKPEALALETASGPQAPAPEAELPAAPKIEIPAAPPAQVPKVQVPKVQAPKTQPGQAQSATTQATPAAPAGGAPKGPPQASPPASPPASQAALAKPASAAPAGGYLIQLASLKDKTLAGREWVRLQGAFPDLLSSKRLVLQSADLGSRGVFHRIRAGYFENRAGAVALCQALKAKNQDCIVVKP